MSEDDDSDKPYEATQKKLDDARKKGEIPRSTDLMTSAAYGGFLLTALVFGAYSVEILGSTMRIMLERADTLSGLVLADGGNTLAGRMMARVGLALVPWFAVPALLVVVSILGQRAFSVTGSKLQPKLSRISLISNVKNKFGRNGLFEFAKSFVKLTIFSIVLGLFLKSQMPEMLTSVTLGPAGVVSLMAGLCLNFFFAVLTVSLLIGAVDFLWQRAEHLRKHRMSYKDMTDEQKQSEGDPHMKQARRQRGYEIATNRMLADVPKADVVLVNPTHYAVALKWNRAKGSAPVCVAKGADEIAVRIREAAMSAGVPLHRDPTTTRSLHATTEVGQEIRQEHYRAVATAIRFADKMRHAQGKRR